MLTTGSFKIYMHAHIYYYIFQVLKENHVLIGIVVLKFLFCTVIKIFMVYFLTTEVIHF